MAGQIIKRSDKTWLVRIFTGRDSKGKRQYLNKTIKGKKKDADTYLRTTLTAISTGNFIEPSQLTMDEYLDKWLRTVAKGRVRERTFQSYEWLLKNYVRPTIGDMRLTDLRPLHIQSLYNRMASPKLTGSEESGTGVADGLGLSARSVRYTHSVLTSALKQAVRWNMLARNPCDVVELPRMIRREMLAFSPEEAMRFLKSAAADSHGTLFGFALATGMRPEEYLALKWSDVDLESGTATIRRTLVWRKGGGWYFGEPKTSRSRRTVPLPASILRSLVVHRREQAERRLKAGVKYENNELVFVTADGKPLNLRNLTQRHFRPILERAGLPQTFRLYDLRHSCATLLLVAGENPKVVSERLGHASVVLTLDTYSHVLPTMQEAASQKLEKILFG